jgi:hypothetical protein
MGDRLEFSQDAATESRVLAALVWAEGIDATRQVGEALDGEIARVEADGEAAVPATTRDAVRAMLRQGA